MAKEEFRDASDQQEIDPVAEYLKNNEIYQAKPGETGIDLNDGKQAMRFFKERTTSHFKAAEPEVK